MILKCYKKPFLFKLVYLLWPGKKKRNFLDIDYDWNVFISSRIFHSEFACNQMDFIACGLWMRPVPWGRPCVFREWIFSQRADFLIFSNFIQNGSLFRVRACFQELPLTWSFYTGSFMWFLIPTRGVGRPCHPPLWRSTLRSWEPKVVLKARSCVLDPTGLQPQLWGNSWLLRSLVDPECGGCVLWFVV